jgi:hypothetical protein
VQCYDGPRAGGAHRQRPAGPDDCLVRSGVRAGHWAGARLSGTDQLGVPDDLALLDTYATSRGDYWSVRQRQLKRVEPSVLARDATVSAKLWDDSAKLAGLAA